MTKQFESKKKQNFKDFYESKYSDSYSGILEWGPDYEVHYMRPLEFGGSNEIDNLFRIPRKDRQEFTSWWVNY